MSHPSKVLWVAAGLGLWLPLLFSFLGAVTMTNAPGIAASQLAMVLFLILATLLLGVLIGRVAAIRAD